MTIIPSEIKTAQLHAYLLGSVGPRPICFASTIDADGNSNLSPFSFFNVFGSKPPILIFSPARRVRDNTIKHTLENVYATGEVVINVVNYAMVQQMSLASCEYPKNVDEFVKAGFTKAPSQIVKPFRVQESPVQLECKVLHVNEMGKEGGAANLILCEVVCMHINEEILNDNRQIDPHKIDLVGRMGGDYYCRASGSAVFVVPKPNMELGIGIDQLPEYIRYSKQLTGNNLGLLGNCSKIPAIDPNFTDAFLDEINNLHSHDAEIRRFAVHHYAKELLDEGHIDKAWQVLLSNNN